MGRVAVLATCALNQWVLDYQGNVDRIIEAVRRAKAAGAAYLCTSELSITGFGCGNHYHERDTEMHAWEALAKIIQHPVCQDIMIDVGLPVMHKDVPYICKLVFLNKNVLFIRPKMILADDGLMSYCETRWFTAWTKVNLKTTALCYFPTYYVPSFHSPSVYLAFDKVREVEDFPLPTVIVDIIGQKKTLIGDAMIATKDTAIGYEICEELWNPESCHLAQCLDGAEIISICTGALEQFCSPDNSYQMVQMASMKSGGCFLIANQKGCDGSVGCYAGDSNISVNGNIVASSKLHTLEEVDVITAAVDLERIRWYRGRKRSRSIHAAKTKPYPRIKVDFRLTKENWFINGIPPCSSITPIVPTKDEQILKTPACWLWGFLRHSGHRGVLLPLTGDVNSSATAAIVFSMCHLVVDAVSHGDEKVLEDVRRLVGLSDYIPSSPKELCGKVVRTVYIDSSSSQTSGNKEIMQELSQQIGSNHTSLDIAETFQSALEILQPFASRPTSAEKSKGGTSLDNLRSRLELAAAYFIAESEAVSTNEERNWIVLASSNVDNATLGSDTKYGRTYGDINLIGKFPEDDIVEFLSFAKQRLNLPVLGKLNLPSKAAEEKMCAFMQIVEVCGPYSMFGRLWNDWKQDLTPSEVSQRVKHFYRRQGLRRLNTLGLPPTFYMPSMGPPDDANPLVYPRQLSWQFEAIDTTVKTIEVAKE